MLALDPVQPKQQGKGLASTPPAPGGLSSSCLRASRGGSRAIAQEFQARFPVDTSHCEESGLFPGKVGEEASEELVAGSEGRRWDTGEMAPGGEECFTGGVLLGTAWLTCCDCLGASVQA